MPRPFHVLVLECDTPVDVVRARLGSYGDIFRGLLSRGLAKDRTVQEQIELHVTGVDVVNQSTKPPLAGVDAVVVSGSKHCAYENHAWIVELVGYVQDCLTANVPLVGICFGHQILARALGAGLGLNDKGWEISVSRVDLSVAGQHLFGVKSLQLQQMHRDIVVEVPDGAVSLGGSDRCDVQGFYIPGRVVTLQAHPEFDAFIMESVIAMRHQQKIFNDELAKDGTDRARLAQDGDLVAATIWKFLLSSSKVEGSQLPN